MSLFFLNSKSQQCLFQFKNAIKRSLELNSNNGRCHFTRQMSQERKFVPFLDMVASRRDEARRSILVQVQSAQSYKELYSYCSSIGTVTKMLHYSAGSAGVEPMVTLKKRQRRLKSGVKNFIAVEFANVSDVDNIFLASSHIDSQVVPVQSHFLWFRASTRKLQKLKQSKNAVLTVENGTKIKAEDEIRQLLLKCDGISNQMNVLYENTRLNDIGVRLRFLTARQVESIVQGMFPHAKAFPFGSSVNGCGKMGCDLDLILRLSDATPKDTSRLVFQCKTPLGSERHTSQRQMETLGDLIQCFLPGCSQVIRILQARVPIIKYYQQLTDIECDLSMSNMSGVYMSDFLYIMGSLDERVWPLIFTVRTWAKEIGLTSKTPGRWITNFSLTLLVLAFLQKPLHSPPVLPALSALVKLARPKDKYTTEDGTDCTFLRDINKLQLPSQNKDNLESLLCEFFEFYAQFDFVNKAVCLNEAVSLTKPDSSAMYIVNPLERGLNVSRNVSIEEMERFRSAVRKAAWTMVSEDKSSNWGLLSLFENKQNANPLQALLGPKQQMRIVDVTTLFEEETEKAPVEYKNETVRKQVKHIKKEHRDKVEELLKLNR